MKKKLVLAILSVSLSGLVAAYAGEWELLSDTSMPKTTGDVLLDTFYNPDPYNYREVPWNSYPVSFNQTLKATSWNGFKSWVSPRYMPAPDTWATNLTFPEYSMKPNSTLYYYYEIRYVYRSVTGGWYVDGNFQTARVATGNNFAGVSKWKTNPYN